jgi:hypothetical protein
MKKGIIAIAIGLLTLVGASTHAEARPHGGHGYRTPANTIYVSGYHHGRPIYTEKIFVGYDCHGYPKFTYQTICPPVRHYAPPCRSTYGGHHHRRSGNSISFTFRR